jgi:plasmid rolling circle replication initiator protein Rep
MSANAKASKSKFSPAMKKVLDRIDANTRHIAKIVSAFEYAEDVDGCEFRAAREQMQRAAILELIARRRTLRTEFLDEWKRLQ